jgi:hypothetical protein
LLGEIHDGDGDGVIFASDYSPYLVGLGKVYQMPPYHEDSKGF